MELWIIPWTCVSFFKKKIFFNVCLFLREIEHEWGRGKERERETQNPQQAPGSELSAQSPMGGLNLQTMRSWPERSRLHWLSPPGAPPPILDWGSEKTHSCCSGGNLLQHQLEPWPLRKDQVQSQTVSVSCVSQGIASTAHTAGRALHESFPICEIWSGILDQQESDQGWAASSS